MNGQQEDEKHISDENITGAGQIRQNDEMTKKNHRGKIQREGHRLNNAACIPGQRGSDAGPTWLASSQRSVTVSIRTGCEQDAEVKFSSPCHPTLLVFFRQSANSVATNREAARDIDPRLCQRP